MGTFMLIFIGIFILVLVISVGAIVLMFMSKLRNWDRDNKSPRLIAEARVIEKKEKSYLTEEVDKGGNYYYDRHCQYYLTFAVENSDKMTFEVNKEDFDMIDEQEFGMLTFQGSRYLGFERR